MMRILALLAVLALAAGVTYWERWSVTHWVRPLVVTIYPIAGDEEARDYVAGLSQSQFQEIADFVRKQGERYRIKQMPAVEVRLGRAVAALPPPPPEGARSALDTLRWSLELRYFAFRNTPFFDSFGKIRLFVVFHEGEEGRALQHSLGLQKGLFGIVHAFARDDQAAQNNVVITHELLHTLGATDKYDAQGLPNYPEGYGEPGDGPHYPQRVAEIMAGRVAVSPESAKIPENLAACLVGYKTAHEINW
jgi:hypothetical protein